MPERQIFSFWLLSPSNICLFLTISKYFLHFFRASLGKSIIFLMIAFSVAFTMSPSPRILFAVFFKVLLDSFSNTFLSWNDLMPSNIVLFLQ